MKEKLQKFDHYPEVSFGVCLALTALSLAATAATHDPRVGTQIHEAAQNLKSAAVIVPNINILILSVWTVAQALEGRNHDDFILYETSSESPKKEPNKIMKGLFYMAASLTLAYINTIGIQ